MFVRYIIQNINLSGQFYTDPKQHQQSHQTVDQTLYLFVIFVYFCHELKGCLKP